MDTTRINYMANYHKQIGDLKCLLYVKELNANDKLWN